MLDVKNYFRFVHIIIETIIHLHSRRHLSELLQAPKFFLSRDLNTNDNSLILTPSLQHGKQWKPWWTNFILTAWNLPRNIYNLKNPEMTIEDFLNYLLLFLRGVPGRAIQMPVSMHRARWMAKVIYAIKMFLFRRQFKVSTPEQNGIRYTLCLFEFTFEPGCQLSFLLWSPLMTLGRPYDKSSHLPTCSYFSCFKQEAWPSLTFIVFV